MSETTTQNSRIYEVLKDERPHSVPEIHARAGTSRLNSRISDLRRWLSPQGKTIVCERVKGRTGAAAYQYTIVPLDLPPAVEEVEFNFADALREEGQLQLTTDEIAPRTEEERYRIFRVKDGGDPEILGTVATEEEIGPALCQWGREGELLDYCVGIQDARDHWVGDQDHIDEEGYGHWVGKWLLLPWQAK